MGDRFAPVDAALRRHCEDHHVPGAVAAIGDRQGVLYERAFGWADGDGRCSLIRESVFRLASMTKLITAVAVMTLVEQGAFDLGSEVASLLPEFGALMVLDGFAEGRPLLRPPRRPATVRDLLAHTSGLSYEVWDQRIMRYQELTGTPGIASGRLAVLATPLVADPGTSIDYGTGYDWASVLVERVSDEGFDAYCHRRILEPLAMSNTSLTVPGGSAGAVPVLRRQADGTFCESGIGYPAEPEFVTGGGCYYSTAGDYLRLQLALLNEGVLDGARVLSEESVCQILTNQTGELEVPVLRSCMPDLSCDVAPGPRRRWGFGAHINLDDEPGRRRAGSAGWWGIYNTTFWVDRQAGVAANLFMQFVPFYCAQALDVAADFERSVYEVISE